MYTINMLSKAHMVKGQGVLSAHDEQVELVRTELGRQFRVLENDRDYGDINHYHTINLGYYFHAAFAKVRRETVGYVHFLPETVENSIKLPWWMKKVFYKYMLSFYNQMDHLVAVNPYFVDVLEKYGVRREKVTYIPNFVSEDDFYKMEEEEREAQRRKFGFTRFTVLCAGQLQKRKGVLEFIETARLRPDVDFVWAGNFAFGSISEGKKEIEQALKSAPENVRFLGLVERSSMNGLYNACDMFFLPSFEELFPMTILEAMNCHKPVLVRDLPIYDRILMDFVQREDREEYFSAWIGYIKENPKEYERAVENAKRGHEFYSRAQVAGMWQQFYCKVMAQSKERYTLRVPVSVK